MVGWIWANVLITVGLFTVTAYFLCRRAVRERRLTPELALFLSTLTLGWMEAVIDWGAFVYYSPSWPHYPTDWPIVRLIPILPLHIPLCYTWFFWGGATMGRWLARFLIARIPRLRFGPALLLAGFVVGFALDAVVENVFISIAGAWSYTQTWGPLTLFAGQDNQWPIYMGFAMGLTIAPFTYLLGKRNDHDEDILESFTRTWRGGVPGRATHWFTYLLSWVVVVHFVYGAVSLGYATLRWSGVQRSVGTVAPYPNGPAWYDDDVTRPDDPDLNREPRRQAVDAGIDDTDEPDKVG